MEYVVEKKPNTGYSKKVKVNSPDAVYRLEEVQAIKDAIKEHILFIGMNRANQVKDVNLLSVGNGGGAMLDSKDLVRTAILNSYDKAILVHNHPSNSLKPSQDDINLTNKMYGLLHAYNIELLDHIIVTEESYVSMSKLDVINRGYEDQNIKILNQTFLKEENEKLKEENKELKIQNMILKKEIFKEEEKGMRAYESVIIIDTKLSEDEAKKEIEKYTEMFKGFSNREVTTEDLGVKRLAYEIRGQKEGRYAVFGFCAESENISDVEREYRLDDNVIKFITIQSEKMLEEFPEVSNDENIEDEGTMEDDGMEM